MKPVDTPWVVGEICDGSDPVLIRHRLSYVNSLDASHDWLAIVTHHLKCVQSNGLPEADYNDSLAKLDESIIRCLEQAPGDMVVLVETSHGKRRYYAYVRGFEAVGKRVNDLIEEHPTHVISYKSVLDADREFVNEYLRLLPQ